MFKRMKAKVEITKPNTVTKYHVSKRLAKIKRKMANKSRKANR